MSDNHAESTSLCSTFVELLGWRAAHQPDRRAYTFLIDGEASEAHLTYAELDRQARAIAALLQERVAIGERVLLLYAPGLEYVAAFLGCLYAGVVAIPAYPPHPTRLDRTLPRLRAIIDDAQPSAVLTTTPILSVAQTLFAHALDFQLQQWLTSDDLSLDLAQAWRIPQIGEDTLALLQYTSGSTTTPKGVMVSHGNLMHNERMIQQAFEHTAQSVVVGWLPMYHDMGLIGNVLQPLYVGMPCVLMSPVAFLQQPFRWLQAISRYQATTSGGPNFAYDLCARKVSPAQRATLDLSSWRIAFNGAEPIRHETLERFATMFAACGFRREALYPCYGLAEATLIVSGGGVAAVPVVGTFAADELARDRAVKVADDQKHGRALVGCGRPLLGQQVVVVDPASSTQCAPGQIGEICVSGAHVAQGYWGRAAETQRSFEMYLADSSAGPFLRTGDLGFVYDGVLFVTGRLKDLIIIRGLNHYPQDIELTVEQSHPAMRPGGGAAFSVDVAGEERLAVVQEVDRHYQNSDLDAVVGAIRQAVAEQHELQVYGIVLLKPGSIPKTSSGKIQRHVCRAMFLDGELEALKSSILDVSPEASAAARADVGDRAEPEAVEAALARIWAEVFELERVDVHDNFFQLGGSSVQATQIIYRIQEVFEVELPAHILMEQPTVTSLTMVIVQHLAEQPARETPKLQALPRGDKHFAQLLAQLDDISERPTARITHGRSDRGLE